MESETMTKPMMSPNARGGRRTRHAELLLEERDDDRLREYSLRVTTVSLGDPLGDGVAFTSSTSHALAAPCTSTKFMLVGGHAGEIARVAHAR
jgi:hypothetical protein